MQIGNTLCLFCSKDKGNAFSPSWGWPLPVLLGEILLDLTKSAYILIKELMSMSVQFLRWHHVLHTVLLFFKLIVFLKHDCISAQKQMSISIYWVHHDLFFFLKIFYIFIGN